MNDLISRQKAIDEIINLWADKPFGNPALVEIKDCIEKLPSAQPERKTGKWIEEPNCYYRCSECGEHYPSILGYMNYNFCPNCGADMRGEQDE